MAADRLVRLVTRIGWAGCLGSIALALLAPGVASLPAVQWSPWLAGLLVLGIPHGAFDHRVGSELRGVEGGSAGPGFYAAYLAAAGLVLACWFASPVLACLGFLVAAAVHFGQGDVYWSRRSGLAARRDSVGYRAALLLTRAALPVALPVLAHPEIFSGEVTAMASRLFGHPAWSVPPWAIPAGLVAVSACAGLQVAWAAVAGWTGDPADCRAAATDICETALLAATFWLVPPVLAVGVYFNAWHSLRHVARLLDTAGATRRLVERGQPARAFARFSADALPMTAGALALMAAIGLAVGRGAASVADAGLVALVLLSALTLPHVLVVTWMDRRQGTWSGPPANRAEEVEHGRA